MNRNDLKNINFYLVTDSNLTSKSIIDDVYNSVKAGCRIVQYREKNKTVREMVEECTVIKRICMDTAFFIINDRIDIALAVNADGIHIGGDDMPFEIARKMIGDEKIIGVTVHNVKEAVTAEKMGADYVGLSPVFTTSTKKDAGIACGIEMVKEVRKEISIPLVAIGGITLENTPDVVRAGADSVAAISALISGGEVYKETVRFIEIINNSKRYSGF